MKRIANLPQNHITGLAKPTGAFAFYQRPNGSFALVVTHPDHERPIAIGFNDREFALLRRDLADHDMHAPDELERWLVPAATKRAEPMPAAAGEYATARQVANYLGIAYATFMALCAKGEGPPRKLKGAKSFVYKVGDVLAWQERASLIRLPEVA